MSNSKPLLDTIRTLEKFPGKGGWTYARIPEILQHPDNPFGWVQVRGSIDDYVLEQYKLMPMGNGHLFLPVKAAIRKKIKKEAGDDVRIVLYADNSRFAVPAEIRECLEIDSVSLWPRFDVLPDGEKKLWCDWIYHAKSEHIKAERIVVLIKSIIAGERFQDKKPFLGEIG